jgi:hypothetical protein
LVRKSLEYIPLRAKGRARGTAQVVEYLPCKLKTLSSNSRILEKILKERRDQWKDS